MARSSRLAASSRYLRAVGRRERSRRRAKRAPAAVEAYASPGGDVLELRERLSAGTLRELAAPTASPGASAEDLWQRRSELLFERLTVSWTISGLPLTGQRELLGRYRMASSEERRWVRETLWAHARERHAELRED